MSAAIVWETGMTAPAPRPWSTRPATSAGIDHANPHSTDPRKKRATPASMRRLRPRTSDSLPKTGVPTAWASR
ncbi:hypothetical protein M768_17115 [Cellulosimicrobium cellulans F16]|uniref:Uncharacterized protein n=1 Tax=Cellulosimicrobium cellulans F16 TaxID=1350482 RepID=A0A0M0F4R7_CELCE|nr:hypothetical protein M768_17115 [Cellulosimicrobium cellulans F16]